MERKLTIYAFAGELTVDWICRTGKKICVNPLNPRHLRIYHSRAALVG